MEQYGSWLLIGVAAIGVAVLADKILLWMEERGWIYYRRKKASSGGGANALMVLHEIFNPGAQQVVVERKHKEEEDDNGDDEKGRRAELKRAIDQMRLNRRSSALKGDSIGLDGVSDSSKHRLIDQPKG